MARLLQNVYWRCSRCGKTNQVRTMLAEYEPTTCTCDNCGEDTLVEAHDLTESPGKFHMPKRHTGEDDGPA